MFVFLTDRPEATAFRAKIETLARITKTLGAALSSDRSCTVGDENPIVRQYFRFWVCPNTAFLVNSVDPTVPT
jgi:hypothetical protein